LLDPQYPIITAVKTALTGLALPVYTSVPPKGKNQKSVDEYVLISQPTLVMGRGSAACVTWDATLMLSVYTKFDRSKVSLVPALNVSSEIMERLLNQRLNLSELSMSPIEVQRLSMPQRFDDLHVYVQDNLRLRFEVYVDQVVAAPTPPSYNLTLSDSNPEGGSVSFSTPNGSSLSFNEVPDAAGAPFDMVFIQNGVSSFATLTAEYLNKSFAFFDPKGTRYDRSQGGSALTFIDGVVYLDAVDVTPPAPVPTPAPVKYTLTLSADNTEGGSVSFATGDYSSISFNEILDAADSPFDTMFVHNGANSFATLTGEYLNKPFAFYDALGKRYDKDKNGNALVFIDGAVYIGAKEAPAPAKQSINDFTPEQIQATYDKLLELQALVCPAPVKNTHNLVTAFTDATGDISLLLIDEELAGVYSSFTVSGGDAEVFYAGMARLGTVPLTVVAGDSIRVTRKSGNPIIKFIGA
jgi:hypothetical protein